MATTPVPAASGPPFPPTHDPWKPWREDALARIGEQQFVLEWIKSQKAVAPEAVDKIEQHWKTAAEAAQLHSRKGAIVERVMGNLDAVETDLLRLAPESYVYASLPSLYARLKRQLPREDPRVERVAKLIE